MIIHRNKPALFGPVPSRRLGQSLGIINVSPKQCSYSCIYCQIGETKSPHTIRGTYFSPGDVYDAVRKKIEKLQASGSRIDYLTFVPTGEPALDENLGETIKLLKYLGIKIAIISNASMLSREDVKNDFQLADYLSLKVDTLRYETWTKINRPSAQLKFYEVIQGIEDLRKVFKGTFATETMLVRDVNDSIKEVEMIADFIGELNPDIAFLALPIRPPAENWAKIPDESKLIHLYQIFQSRINRVEYLIDYEGSDFGYDKNDIRKSILEITRVHPLREDVLKQMISKAKEEENIIDELIMKDQLTKSHYMGKVFYIGRNVNN
jgi:wyosine [tRNA(Phe)-imidazoG37] synthetase (radical SAM superfamily)